MKSANCFSSKSKGLNSNVLQTHPIYLIPLISGKILCITVRTLIWEVQDHILFL